MPYNPFSTPRPPSYSPKKDDDEAPKLSNDEAQRAHKRLKAMRDEMKKRILGQDPVIDRIIIGLLCRGHILIEGVPGLAKTSIIKALASCIDASFQRIQFTPDLLPSDLIGTQIYDQRTHSFSTHEGPIFSHFILADEINRAPAKVQSALLEAMEERQVTIGKVTHHLHEPFIVFATENPLDHEGTYALPEAQMDRFLFKIEMSYPDKETEIKIVAMESSNDYKDIIKNISIDEIIRFQDSLHMVHSHTSLIEYAIEIVSATRTPKKYPIKHSNWITRGASPRASIALIRAGKAHALYNGRNFSTPEDIHAVAYDILRHRIAISYDAEGEGWGPNDAISEIISGIDIP